MSHAAGAARRRARGPCLPAALARRRCSRTSSRPLLFLAAMGIGLGGLVDERERPVDGRRLPRFVAPGLMAATRHAAGGGRVAVAGDGRHQVDALLPRHGGHAGRAGRRLLGGCVVWTACAPSLSAAVFLVVAALLGGVPSPWGVLAIPAAVLGASAFAAPLDGLRGHPGDRPHASPSSCASVMHAAVPVLGHVLPGRASCPTGCDRWRWLSPLWHGVELCRAATTGRRATGHAVTACTSPCSVRRRRRRLARGARRTLHAGGCTP